MTDQVTLAANTLSGTYAELQKIQELAALGIWRGLISTFCALTDYVNNQTSECFPHMQALTRTLGFSARTVQHHLHKL